MDSNTLNKDHFEICPNCLEPNAADLANCSSCGMPLRVETDGGAEPNHSLEDGAALAVEVEKNAAESAKPAENQSAKKSEKGKGWSYAMRGMGVYLIFIASSEIPRSLKIEDPKTKTIALVSNAIYIIAGILLVFPLIHEYWVKRKQPKDAPSEMTIEATPEEALTSDVKEPPQNDPQA